jgi:hypothetical protein
MPQMQRGQYMMVRDLGEDRRQRYYDEGEDYYPINIPPYVYQQESRDRRRRKKKQKRANKHKKKYSSEEDEYEDFNLRDSGYDVMKPNSYFNNSRTGNLSDNSSS